MKAIFGWLAVGAALVSASLWLWAARVKIDAAEFGAEFGAYGGATPASVAAFRKQNSLNSYAAVATAASALLQPITLAVP
jgi:hypothetical protein